MHFRNNILISLRALIVFTILTGITYPALITLVAQLFVSDRANGSLITRDGTVKGSELIGQKFMSDRYFQSRPSAIGCNPFPSGASNLGPTSEILHKLVNERRESFIEKNHLTPNTAVPAEMLFASGSGVDPHIGPEAALMQVDRIAQARGFDEQKKALLKTLVQIHIEAPQFGILGEPRVNVLHLNLALDSLM
jgi:K+-transporting ATPase ATPase C chain